MKTTNHDFQRVKFDKPLFQVAPALLSPKPSGDELTCPKAPKKQVNFAEDIKSIPYILSIENNHVPFRRNGSGSFLQRVAAIKKLKKESAMVMTHGGIPEDLVLPII